MDKENVLYTYIYTHTVEYYSAFKKEGRDFPGGTVVKNLPANAGDLESSLVLEDPT